MEQNEHWNTVSTEKYCSCNMEKVNGQQEILLAGREVRQLIQQSTSATTGKLGKYFLHLSKVPCITFTHSIAG